MITKIEFTCKAGHSQIMTYTGMTREFAQTVAQLTDGSSPLYKFPPGPESAIGKCGICGAQLTSRILDDVPEATGNSVQNPFPPPSATGS